MSKKLGDTTSQREIANMLVKQMPTVLSMLLEGRDINLTVDTVTTSTFNELKNRLREELVLVDTEFTGDITSPSIFLFKKDVVSLITNLLMGLGETPGDVSQTELSAFEEVTGQVLPSCGVSLSSSINKNVNVRINKVLLQFFNVFTPPQIFLQDEVAYLTYKISIDTLLTSQFYVILPSKMIDDIEKCVAPKIEPAAPSVTVAQEKPTIPVIEEERKEVEVQKVKFAEFKEVEVAPALPNIDLVLDVPLQISVELGRATKSIKEIIELTTGSIVELNKMEGEPVDILANGKLFAKGEVVVIGETFGVRIVEILSPRERITKIGRE